MSFAPNETSSDLFLERTQLDGVFVGSAFLGVLSMLTWSCLSNLLGGKHIRQVKWALVGYVILMFSLAFVYIASVARYTELMFIDDRDFPGGPLAFWLTDFFPEASVSPAVWAVINVFTDGLLLVRCAIFWDWNWLVMAIPFLTFLATIGLAIVSIFEQVSPHAAIFLKAITVPWFGLSIALNLVLTMLILGKLLYARNRLRAVLGESHARLYTSVSAMIVESAALDAVSSIVVIVSYARGSFFLNICLPVHAVIMPISQFLIIDRVARGHAYSKGTVSGTSTHATFNIRKHTTVEQSATAVSGATDHQGSSYKLGIIRTRENSDNDSYGKAEAV